MPVFLPAAALRHHDREPGSHCLDHKGYEFLSGEYGNQCEAHSIVQYIRRSESGR